MNAPVFNAEDVAKRAHVPSIKTVCNDLAYEAAFEALDDAVSYAISAREAAYRGNRRLLDGHLREMLLCVLTAIEARKLLSGPEVA